ncbi:excinuclease ABC subunit UvrA [Gelidibacter salicanalis]|uniref:UvrABC system protein A n=1 Tax=Gelidibacter salicanalis TaxID=291193 RepID=A0A934NCE7_9FLAO|nr:excinuclease ABC subunit UvrA [Gelidibacter salicanalis]MBJ7880635.1 excinuclease ABC subunit UvrA [Gelidibacter salicanalis]
MNQPNDHASQKKGFVTLRGARQHNLKNISIEIPRDALVVFTGVSGSGKSSLAFGTLYAEAQRRYLESVSPYARRLFHQMPIPEVDQIEGLPPAVALQQQRGSSTTRSSVGSVTTLSNLLRMLYSRAGDYPPGQSILYAESFSANTPEGACPQCHGLGKVYEVTEKSMVPDDSLTIRERAIAAWPSAWQGQNFRDILTTLGYDVDIPWKNISKKDRDWILFTTDKPKVPVYPGFSREEVQRAIKNKMEPSYMGTFTGAKKYVLHTFANTQSTLMKKRVSQYMLSSACPTCNGKRLNPESLSISFSGYDIVEMSRLPLKKLLAMFSSYGDGTAPGLKKLAKNHEEKAIVAQRIAEDLVARLHVLMDLGLGYLSLERSTPTLSPGEHQRLRLATQVRSNLFGVVYVLDEPSAGLHPADTEALLKALNGLKASGNSLFVVEHELDVIRHADWIVDVGPDAGEGGGEILYSGPPEGLRNVARSKTGTHLFNEHPHKKSIARSPSGWLTLKDVTRNNLKNLDVSFPLGVLTSVTGVSGSGKSSLVSQVLVELLSNNLGKETTTEEVIEDALQEEAIPTLGGSITEGAEHIKRMVVVNQKPIGRTPRSNLATYTGLFDVVRKLFAFTELAKRRQYNAGRFSFNVGKGRCPNCEGEGFVMVELLFLPSVYAPCPVCKGTRYNAETLEVKYHKKNIAEVLKMTVNEAQEFFKDEERINRALNVLQEVGLGYLRLGQPATELSGGEAQRIKLATELHRQSKGHTIYILDEPTTGLHPTDVEKLQLQLSKLVNAGNTVIVVEHDMQVIADSDWVIDIGPGAGDEGGKIVATGTPEKVANNLQSKTALYLKRHVSLMEHVN